MNIQIVKVSESLLDYFVQEAELEKMDFKTRVNKLSEFKRELEKALNTGAATKQVEWVQPRFKKAEGAGDVGTVYYTPSKD